MTGRGRGGFRRPCVRPIRHRRARAPPGTAATTCSSAARLCPLTNASQYGQRGGHAADQRRVARRRLAGVDPDDPVRQPAQPPHRLGHLLRVVGRPAVGQHDDDRAAGQPPPAVVGDEPRRCPSASRVPPAQSEAVAPARASAWSGSRHGQLPGEPGQPGGEDERLRPRPGDRALQQRQVDPRVGLHRAGDVAQQHQPPRPACAGARAPAAPGRRRCAAPPARCAAGRAGRRAPAAARVRRLRRSGVLSTSRRTSSRTLGAARRRSGRRTTCAAAAPRSTRRPAGPRARSPRRRRPPPAGRAARRPPDAVPGLRGRRSGGAGRVRGSQPIGGGAVGSPRLSAGSSRPSKTAEKTASNTGSWARSVTSATRQVQYSAAPVDRRHQPQRPGQPGGPLRASPAGRPGAAPSSGRRRAGPARRRRARLRHRPARPHRGLRASSWSSRFLSTEPQVASTAGGVQAGQPEQRSAPPPSR